MTTHDINRENFIHTAIGIAIVFSAITMLPIASSPIAMAQTIQAVQDQSSSPSTNTGVPSMSPFSSFPGSMSGLPTQMGSAFGNETRNFTLHSAAGISMVKGVRITGISENDANRTITITLSSNATTTTGNAPAVTVEATRMSFDLMSLLQQYQMMSSLMAREGAPTNSSSAFMPGELDDLSGKMMTGTSQNNTLDGGRELASMFNITTLFQSMETGSNVLQQGWTSPQQVSITLESNKTSLGSLSSSASSTVLSIVVIPFTGGQNMTATSSPTTTLSPNNTAAIPG